MGAPDLLCEHQYLFIQIWSSDFQIVLQMFGAQVDAA